MEYYENLQEISYASPDYWAAAENQSLALWHVWHDHPLPKCNSPVGGVPQLISALLLMLRSLT